MTSSTVANNNIKSNYPDEGLHNINKQSSPQPNLFRMCNGAWLDCG